MAQLMDDEREYYSLVKKVFDILAPFYDIVVMHLSPSFLSALSLFIDVFDSRTARVSLFLMMMSHPTHQQKMPYGAEKKQ